MEFLHVSAKQYRDMLAGKVVPKENKYHAKKTEVNGVVFDSKFEGDRWKELCILEKSGKISNLQRQVRFILQDGFINNVGEKVRSISYNADFTYESNGKKYVEDTKSPATRTEVYKIKKKLFQYKYPEWVFVETIK
jgi:hypothetical protein